MITKPSCSQLLESVRSELRTTILPAVSNPEVHARLGMIDSILASVAVRCEHEVAWLREEIREIERGAEAVIAAGVDRGARVATALNVLRENRSDSDHLADLHAEYNFAGEVLSCSLEASMPVGGELRKIVEGILAARLAREVEIRGEFSLAGRQ